MLRCLDVKRGGVLLDAPPLALGGPLIVNTYPSKASMNKAKKTKKICRKVIHKKLTYIDVREAGRDGQTIFDAYVITGEISPHPAPRR
jgi:hypothetical protein